MLFNHELKSSSLRLHFCCFLDATIHNEAASSNYNNDGDSDGCYHGAAQSPCLRLYSMARELPLSEIQYNLQSLVTRIKRCRKQGHITTLEFGYDMMSYALNFEDG
ncbi:hypothetical protein ACJRO7_014568 [Eucalyptus globulus]|uniref:Uncharacterized protein n=1 Tax=Eucalyptus globulus TaxID=34317 RepID=A0ABD3L1K8_EUCGL